MGMDMEHTPRVGDYICYVQRYIDPEGYRVVKTPINKIVSGKMATKCHSKRFSPIDIEELKANTRWLLKCKELVLVTEPFLDVEDLVDRAESWCENKGWLNKNV